MSINLGQKIAYKLRHYIQPRTIFLDDLALTTDLNYIPKDIQKQLYRKQYESQELHLVKPTLDSDDRVLEIGAGIGFISLVCARICGAENVLSYEPNPHMKSVIEKNFALNGLKPNLRNKVLATQSGQIDFFISDSVLSSSILDRQQGQSTLIEADTIEDVLSEFKPTVIVMDVEGAEIDLLQCWELAGVSKLVVEMHPHIVGEQQIDNLCIHLKNEGFDLEERLGKVYRFANKTQANKPS